MLSSVVVLLYLARMVVAISKLGQEFHILVIAERGWNLFGFDFIHVVFFIFIKETKKLAKNKSEKIEFSPFVKPIVYLLGTGMQYQTLTVMQLSTLHHLFCLYIDRLYYLLSARKFHYVFYSCFSTRNSVSILTSLQDQRLSCHRSTCFGKVIRRCH